jgi:hypothetical protein
MSVGKFGHHNFLELIRTSIFTTFNSYQTITSALEQKRKIKQMFIKLVMAREFVLLTLDHFTTSESRFHLNIGIAKLQESMTSSPKKFTSLTCAL